MFTPPLPPYTCQQLFYIDKMKSAALTEIKDYFDRANESADYRPLVRLMIDLNEISNKKQFLERFELLIFRRTIFKFIGDNIYIDVYESEVAILLNMPEVADVTIMGPG